jgi:N-acetylglucosaminyldiphosphoundecaprenol N-acetyl-beta-D-mannosaminyltransferase
MDKTNLDTMNLDTTNLDTTDQNDFKRTGAPVLGTFVDAASFESALATTTAWATNRESRTLYFCNVHAVVTMQRDAQFGRAVAQADLVLPDGMPVAWMLRKSGFPRQQRINGPDFMHRYCALAERRGEPVFFYGSTQQTLDALRDWAATLFPRLRIVGMFSPPFRTLLPEEDDEIVEEINASGARIVFVGLGCPKQELWMAAHRGRIQAVMIGVGAAFDYHAGTLQRAPLWMQRHGLEWCFRLYKEPRRLWKRYLVSNTLFLLGAAGDLLRRRCRLERTSATG